MKSRRDWTLCGMSGVALLTLGGISWFSVNHLKIARFEDSIAEAGGAVLYQENFSRSYQIGGKTIDLSDRKPIAVAISSGSHPIPEALKRLKGMKSVKRLSLNTSEVGDYLVPILSTFRHLRILDLSKTEISAGAVIQLLDALPGLKEFRLSREKFSEEGLSELLAHRLSNKVIFSGPDW